jgi:hypothetical protein
MNPSHPHFIPAPRPATSHLPQACRKLRWAESDGAVPGRPLAEAGRRRPVPRRTQSRPRRVHAQGHHRTPRSGDHPPVTSLAFAPFPYLRGVSTRQEEHDETRRCQHQQPQMGIINDRHTPITVSSDAKQIAGRLAPRLESVRFLFRHEPCASAPAFKPAETATCDGSIARASPGREST